MVDTIGYCEPSDIDLGGMALPNPDPRTGFIASATDEMNAKLGLLYAVPIDTETILEHERLMLKVICYKIASGRMLATYSIPEEGGSVHAYAKRLLDEGMSELHMVANGDYVLSAAKPDLVADDLSPDGSGVAAMGARTPSVYNPDSESAVTAFNNQVFGGVPTRFPGFDDGGI